MIFYSTSIYANFDEKVGANHDSLTSYNELVNRMVDSNEKFLEVISSISKPKSKSPDLTVIASLIVAMIAGLFGIYQAHISYKKNKDLQRANIEANKKIAKISREQDE